MQKQNHTRNPLKKTKPISNQIKLSKKQYKIPAEHWNNLLTSSPKKSLQKQKVYEIKTFTNTFYLPRFQLYNVSH